MARFTRTAALALATIAVAFLAPVGAGAASGGVSVAAVINGHKAAGADSVKLSPSSSATLQVTVTNDSDNAVSARTVRLEGRVIGLVFYAYDTSIVLDVAAHSTQTRTIQLDVSGLNDQAVGLIPSQVQVLDSHRNEIASQDLTIDVRGSLWSVYGLFGLVILLLTILWTASVLVRLFRGSLPENRWVRATLFLVPGIGIGLVFVFTLSALRFVAPTAPLWVPVVVGAAALMFVVGYLTPTPSNEESEADEDVVTAGAILPGDGW
jgi:hypothetical protein